MHRMAFANYLTQLSNTVRDLGFSIGSENEEETRENIDKLKNTIEEIENKLKEEKGNPGQTD